LEDLYILLFFNFEKVFKLVGILFEYERMPEWPNCLKARLDGIVFGSKVLKIQTQVIE